MSEFIKKEQIFSSTCEHISLVREKITSEIHKVDFTLQQKTREKPGSAVDEIVQKKLLQHCSDRLDQLHHLFNLTYISILNYSLCQNLKKSISVWKKIKRNVGISIRRIVMNFQEI